MQDLTAKLKARYSDSVVDALLKQLHITSVTDFKRRANLFVELVYKAPVPFNPNDPANIRDFQLNVCVMFQADLKVGEVVQAAKLCRSILEYEHDFTTTSDGGAVVSPYAFVVMFPDAIVQNDAIAGLTAAQIKAGVAALFAAERIVAQFAA
jgi:hypothetical protein